MAKITKCDVCPYSILLRDGKLICPFRLCLLQADDELRKEIFEILKGKEK